MKRSPSHRRRRRDYNFQSVGSDAIYGKGNTPHGWGPGHRCTWPRCWNICVRKYWNWRGMPPGITKRRGSFPGILRWPSKMMKNSTSYWAVSRSLPGVSYRTSMPFSSPRRVANKQRAKREERRNQEVLYHTLSPQYKHCCTIERTHTPKLDCTLFKQNKETKTITFLLYYLLQATIRLEAYHCREQARCASMNSSVVLLFLPQILRVLVDVPFFYARVGF